MLTGTEGQGLKVLEGMCADMPGDSDFRLWYGLCVCVCGHGSADTLHT